MLSGEYIYSRLSQIEKLHRLSILSRGNTSMRAFVFACIIAAFCVTASLQDTPYYSCSGEPSPLALRIDGCDSSPCIIYKGTTLTAQWDFAAVNDVKELKPSVIVTLLGNKITYPYPEKDACKSLVSGECPLKKGAKATYNLEMPIDKSLPSVSLNIEFALVDDKKEVQVCFSVDAKVTTK
ncbi:NPC intracellular cholesterol transporter 2-like [Nylanderia fulva]|uniref:NPC intracellular cholesterol transporter 2-like n=1 Tax=Nylanderia fulva TaxID=613905 RepID=UPI0010FBA6F0|nr:NPC intracellular cholesterol transporter 2-like [Nylanderia fulva]